jgi:hypothetical protein
MKPEQENFDQLRRLLALKRHEQPPPGYFNGFSRQVIGRIKAGTVDDRAPALQRLFKEAPWVERLWSLLDTKPAIPGMFGALVCMMLIFGIVYSERVDKPENAGAAAPEMAIAPALAVEQPTDLAMMVSSTNPVIQPGGSLFDQFRIDAQPASFQTGSH